MIICYMNDNYCAESKSRSTWTNTEKKELFQLKISCTHFYNKPVDMLKRGEGNIVRGIFINYGELHDNYQHS